MAPVTAELVAVAGALAVIVVGATLIPGVARVLLIAQASYWAMSYLARPVVLLWCRPRPQYGDSIADPRLADLGYPFAISQVLPPVVFGLWVYAGLVVGYALWRRGRPEPPYAKPDPRLLPTLGISYGLGMLARAGSYLSGSIGGAGDVASSHPFIDFLTMLGAIGALGMIIFVRLPRPGATAAVLAILVVGELGWSALVESKTPIMGAALGIAVRFAVTGWTRAKVAGMLGIALAAIGGFGRLQSFKESPSARASGALLNAGYPGPVQPFLSALRRFDLLEAATDSYFYRSSQHWMSGGEFFGHAVRSLVPTQLLGGEKYHAGTAWAEQVRGASVDMSRIQVSLAEGNINEGWLFGGHAGVVLCVAFTFALLLCSTWALRGRYILALICLGLALVELPVLFERGILGSFEVLGKVLQVSVLVWLVYLSVGEYQRVRAERTVSVRACLRTRVAGLQTLQNDP